MTLFDARNVLDRLERSGKIFFQKDWISTFFPIILLAIITTWVGVYFAYLMLTSIPDIESIHDRPFEFVNFLIYMLMVVSIFTTLSGLIGTYTITFLAQGDKKKSWQEILSLGFERLWGWGGYVFWMSLVSLLFFTLGGLAVFFFGEYSVIPLIFLIGFFIWFMVGMSAGYPGYIIENSMSFSRFLSCIEVTRARWWRVLGNSLVTYIVIGSALSLIEQILFSYSGSKDLFREVLEGVQSYRGIEGIAVVENIIADVSLGTWVHVGLSYSLLLIIYFSRKIFMSIFQYVVWDEIHTPHKSTH